MAFNFTLSGTLSNYEHSMEVEHLMTGSRTVKSGKFFQPNEHWVGIGAEFVDESNKKVLMLE